MESFGAMNCTDRSRFWCLLLRFSLVMTVPAIAVVLVVVPLLLYALSCLAVAVRAVVVPVIAPCHSRLTDARWRLLFAAAVMEGLFT